VDARLTTVPVTGPDSVVVWVPVPVPVPVPDAPVPAPVLAPGLGLDAAIRQRLPIKTGGGGAIFAV